MKKENHLWKDIGFHNQMSSPDSSFKGAGPPQLKGYKIDFDNFSESEEPSEEIIRIHKVESIQQSEDPIQQNPNLITLEAGSLHKGSEEEVVEAISFHSQQQQRLEQSRQILNTLKDECFKPKTLDVLQKSMGTEGLKSMTSKNIFLKEKVQMTIEDVLELKMELEQYKMYLLDVLSHWQVTAIQDCQKMSEYINRRFEDLKESKDKIKEDNVKSSIKMSMKSSQALKELELVKANLSTEKQKGEKMKEEIYELQAKLAKKSNNIDLQLLKNKEQTNMNLSFLRKQLLKTEKERDDFNIQKEENIRQLTKTKDLLRDKQHEIQLLNEENQHLIKQLSEVKRQFEDSGSRQRKLEMKVQLQIEQNQIQTTHREKQISKHKQELVKFRELLKNSEEQLRQCESYISSVKNQNKALEDKIDKLGTILKEEQMAYYKKLQKYDKLLIEIEKNVEEMGKSHLSKIERIKGKEAELEKIREQMEDREFGIKQRQYQLEELKKELRNEIYMLERKEEGMRAEYKMAIEAQNATKDKWYQRYYQLTSEQENYSKKSGLTRDTTSNYLNFNLPTFKKPSSNLPVREKTSPSKTILTKAKSEQNIYLGSPRRLQTSRKTEFMVPECYKDNSLTSRINNLRAQLSKELNQVNTP